MAGASDERNAIIVLTVLTVVATIVVLFRLKRRKSKGFLGADDWIVVAALAVLYVQDFWAYKLATVEGRPYQELTETEKKWFHKTYFFGNIGYCVHVTIIKIAILISYKRIFGHILWTRHAIHLMAILSLLWGLGAFFPFIFQCKPIRRAYEPWILGTCEKMQTWLWATAISNMIMDWMILLLPIVPLYSLRSRLGNKEKGLVFASFALGSLTCVATSMRACLNTWGYDKASTSVFLASISTYAEPMIAIISACLPFLSLNHVVAKTFSQIRRLFSKGQENHGTLERYALDTDTKSGNIGHTVTELQTTHVIYRIGALPSPSGSTTDSRQQTPDSSQGFSSAGGTIQVPTSAVLIIEHNMHHYGA